MLSLYILSLLPLAAVATLNGHCTGSSATGAWGTHGICVTTATCGNFHGASNPAPACPFDPDNVQCCEVGIGDNAQQNPCGGTSYCTWTSNGCPGGAFDSRPFCPGGDNYQCCRRG